MRLSTSQSSKAGQHLFTVWNAGSSPVCGTNMLPWSKGWAPAYEAGLCRFESCRELHLPS